MRRLYRSPEIENKRKKLIEEYTVLYNTDPIKKRQFKPTDKWVSKILKKKRKIAKKKLRKCRRLSKRNSFYNTIEWKELRYEVLKKYDRKCMVCFRTNVVLHVDHIKPISKFPELAMSLSNLQILCASCNLGKGNKDSIDWRPIE